MSSFDARELQILKVLFVRVNLKKKKEKKEGKISPYL